MNYQLQSVFLSLGASFKALLSKLNPFKAQKSLQEELALAGPVNAEAVTSTMLLEFVRDRRRERRWAGFRRALVTTFIVVSLGLSVYTTLALTGSLPTGGGNSVASAANDTVALVNIRGAIGGGPLGNAETIIPVLRKAFDDPKINVIVLRIDSPGGSPLESERINSEIDRLKAKTAKRVEAVIDAMGASAAYMIAVHADRITAGRYSLVGSVGAIMHLWNGAELAEKLGVTQQTYASGALKDFGNMTRTPSAAEQAKGLALVSGLGAIFGDEVIAARGSRLHIKRADLTTGEAWSGVEAVTLGLVDDIGTVETVLARYDAKGKNFGPFPNSGMGGLFAQWASDIGSGFAGGVVSRLQSESHNAKVN